MVRRASEWFVTAAWHKCPACRCTAKLKERHLKLDNDGSIIINESPATLPKGSNVGMSHCKTRLMCQFSGGKCGRMLRVRFRHSGILNEGGILTRVVAEPQHERRGHPLTVVPCI